MYYSITSLTPNEVKLNLTAEFLTAAQNIHTIVFDNALGSVRLADKDNANVAYIPYSDIDYFDVQKSGVAKNSNSRYSYDVVMNLKNLSSWHLFRLYNEVDANTELKRLTEAVKLGNPNLVQTKPQLATPPITTSKEENKTVLRWRNSVTPGYLTKVIGWSTAFAIMLVVLWQVMQSRNVSFIGYFIFLVCVVMFVGAVATQVNLILKDRSTAYGMSFSPTAVEYFEESTTGGNKKKSLTIPAADWFGLSYSNSSEYGQSVLLLSKEGYDNYRSQKLAGTKFNQMIKALATSNQFQQLRFKDLTPVQRLSLVNWVTEETKKH